MHFGYYKWIKTVFDKSFLYQSNHKSIADLFYHKFIPDLIIECKYPFKLILSGLRMLMAYLIPKIFSGSLAFKIFLKKIKCIPILIFSRAIPKYYESIIERTTGRR